MGFCGENKTYTDQPQYVDPLGPSWVKDKNGYDVLSSGLPTGAIERRDEIYGKLDDLAPAMEGAGQQLASGLATAAKDPGWGAAADEARKTISGGYLGGGPEFNKALDDYQAQADRTSAQVKSGAAAAAADTAADTSSRYGRAGLGFSTGNQQAVQADTAAGAARANELAAGIQGTAAQAITGAKTQNYAQERANQQQGATKLQEAVGQPLEYLQAIPSAYMNPLSQEAGLVTGMASGGSMATPQSTIVRNPGIYDQAMSGIGALAGGAAGGF